MTNEFMYLLIFANNPSPQSSPLRGEEVCGVFAKTG